MDVGAAELSSIGEIPRKGGSSWCTFLGLDDRRLGCANHAGGAWPLSFLAASVSDGADGHK